jgi:cation diffusion facilitator family transporter
MRKPYGERVKEKISIIGVLVNLLLAVAKIGVGVLSNSAAVIAEGLHSGMDIVSSAVSYIGIRIARKPVDKEHPYGHYKSEVIAGLIITIILFLTGLWIIYEAFIDFFTSKELAITYITLIVMAGSALVNEAMARLKIHYGKKSESMALLADGQHSRIDVFVSMGVFIGLFLVNYWVHIDSIIAAAIGIYILIESVSLGRKTTDSLLDVKAEDEVENHIKNITRQQGIDLAELKTRKLGPIISAELKINIDPKLKVDEASAITKNLENNLTNEIPNLKYVVVQIETHEIKQEFYRGTFGQRYGWKGRMGGKGLGPGGECVCPKCGYRTPHTRGTPCMKRECPKCKSPMARA